MSEDKNLQRLRESVAHWKGFGRGASTVVVIVVLTWLFLVFNADHKGAIVVTPKTQGYDCLIEETEP